MVANVFEFPICNMYTHMAMYAASYSYVCSYTIVIHMYVDIHNTQNTCVK